MPFYSRKATRIPNFDYSSYNYYFITICTHEKNCIFGTPMQLNSLGKIAEKHILHRLLASLKEVLQKKLGKQIRRCRFGRDPFMTMLYGIKPDMKKSGCTLRGILKIGKKIVFIHS